jgi:ribosome-associated translation inhibitor RaiA
MRLQVKGKNVEVTPSIREYAERKLGKLSKVLVDKLERQVKRYREMRRLEPRRHAPQLDDLPS